MPSPRTMNYSNCTDHIRSPAALIRHLHSCVFLDGETDLQEPLEEEVEVGEREEVGDTDRPPVGVEMDSGVPEECFRGLKDLPWRVSALERSLYLSLPSWVHAALFFNFFGHVGKSGLPDLSLPMRLVSYLLLPYTLPAAAIFHLNYRFMCLAHWETNYLLKWFRGVQEKDHWQRWNRTLQEKSHWLSWIRGLTEKSNWPMWITGLQEKAHWLWWDVRQVVKLLVRASVSSLKTVLPTRLSSLRFPSLHFPAVSLQSLQSILLPSLQPLQSILLPSLPSPSLCPVSFPALSLLLRILPSLRCLSFGSAPQTEPVPARGTGVLRHRRSVLRFHLSTTTSSSSSISDSVDSLDSPQEPSRAVFFLFNLHLEVKDEQPDLEIYPAPPLLPAPPPELSSDEEVEEEDEGLCSPYISFLAVKEEDGRDDVDSDVEDVWDSSSSQSCSEFSHQRAVSE